MEPKSKLKTIMLLVCIFAIFPIIEPLPISLSKAFGGQSDNVGILEEIPGTRLPTGRFMINYARVFFIDQKTGYFTARDRMGRTEDGGKTWEVKSLGLLGEPTFALFFLNKNVGWYADFDWVRHTNDGGKTWKKMKRVTMPDEGTKDILYFDDFYFITEKKGFGISGVKLFQTEDAGLNWTKVYEISGRGHLSSISSVDPLTGWVGGTDIKGSFVLSTKDGGKSWQKTYIGEGSTKYLTFLDAKTGWASGYVTRNTQDQTKTKAYDGLIFRTTDGGKTWEKAQLPPEASMPYIRPIYHIHMKNRQEGWAVGGWYIFHTLDGGTTWKTIATNVQKEEEFIYVTLVEQDKRPALLIASKDAIYRMLLE